jgi:hypothetical protein
VTATLALPLVGSSIFLGGLEVQWHTLSRRFANVEIDKCMFVAFGVLLSPQYQQKRRKLRKDGVQMAHFVANRCHTPEGDPDRNMLSLWE